MKCSALLRAHPFKWEFRLTCLIALDAAVLQTGLAIEDIGLTASDDLVSIGTVARQRLEVAKAVSVISRGM